MAVPPSFNPKSLLLDSIPAAAAAGSWSLEGEVNLSPLAFAALCVTSRETQRETHTHTHTLSLSLSHTDTPSLSLSQQADRE